MATVNRDGTLVIPKISRPFKKRLKPSFTTETELCACFINSLKAVGGWTVYPETAGFDILVVHETGIQHGVEAKLHLNAKVADQILPQAFDHETVGPNFRSVIVPELTEASHGIARMLRMLGPVFVPKLFLLLSCLA